jgi:hypothetical protein
MTQRTEELYRRIAAYTAHNKAADTEFAQIIALTKEFEASDEHAAPILLDLAEVAGTSEQARHGHLIQALAQVDRIKANRAGLIPWIATHLDVTNGKARGIARSARRIGAEPELTTPLCSGQIGADTIRALARADKAIANTQHDKTDILTETLELAQREGVSAVNKHVRELEDSIDPGKSEKLIAAQRQRSFLRIIEADSGMCRIETLLDPVRATILRASLDTLVSAWVRARQHGHADPVPEDVRSIEQLQAQAITRLAEVFLAAGPKLRQAAFNPPALYTTPVHADEGGELVETNYGDLVPGSVVAPVDLPAAHMIEHVDGRLALADGKRADIDPSAHLAIPAQRSAPTNRDRE